LSDFDLNAFLATQLAEGTSQGEGGFTISHEKAALKMSQYSLPREHAWVLKIVQAAVAWKCFKIDLTQTRTESTFRFSSHQLDQLPSNHDLVSAILRADPESGEPLESLGAALRILVEKTHLSFHLLIDKGQDEPQAIYAGVYYGEMDEAKRALRREGWGPGINLAINHIPHTEVNRLLLNYVPIRRNGLPMMMELEKYAYVSPVPITVDGRRLDGVLRSSVLNWNYHRKPLRIAGVEIPGDLDPPLPICDGFTNLVLSVYSRLEDFRSEVPLKRSEAYFVLAAEVGKDSYETTWRAVRSRIYWVRNGVIVDEEPLPISTRTLELTIYASADGLEADLTGFQLIKNQAYQERRERLLKRITEVLKLERLAERDIFFREKPMEEQEDVPQEGLTKIQEGQKTIARKLKNLATALRVEQSQDRAPGDSLPNLLISAALVALQRSVIKTVNWEATDLLESYPAELDILVQGLVGEPPKSEPVESKRSKSEPAKSEPSKSKPLMRPSPKNKPTEIKPAKKTRIHEPLAGRWSIPGVEKEKPVSTDDPGKTLTVDNRQAFRWEPPE
jgi:hypothetical protein